MSKPWLFLSALGIFWFVLLIVFWAGFNTRRAVYAVKSFEFAQASQAARRALLVVRPLDRLTFHRVADVHFWVTGLDILAESSNLNMQAQRYLSTTFEPAPPQPTPATQLSETIQQLTNRAAKLDQLLPKTWLAQVFLKNTAYQTFLPPIQDLNTVVQTLLQGRHKFVVLLQNTDELRATGGFMGSYAIVELQDGQVIRLDIQDIYEPDGQFRGFIEAPPGQKEYLSSGHGLRLPDANWDPDFPKSAQMILSFFPYAKEANLEGVVAVNLSLAQSWLRVMGEVYLPDYGVTVTPDNLTALARSDRQQFFPGSRQKKNFLGALLNQLKFKLTELTPAQQQSLLQLTWQELRQKNIQLYATAPQLQSVWARYNFAGELGSPDSSALYLALIESNVGINKVNQNVTRQVAVIAEDFNTQLQIFFRNHQTPNSTDAGHYVNYQRVYVSPNQQLTGITIGNQPLEKWDEQLITTSRGEQLREVGFLVVVKAQTEETINIKLVDQEPLTLQPSFFIQKQAGLPSTPYSIRVNEQTQWFNLEKDELVRF